MCHHPSSTIRTRRIKAVSETNSHGTGRLRMIQYVKFIGDDTYKGHFRNGRPYFVTGARIRAKPKMYRLRKEHADCYQLVITQVESTANWKAPASNIGDPCRGIYQTEPGRCFT